MKKKQEFVLPEHWYIRVSNMNFEAVNKWRWDNFYCGLNKNNWDDVCIHSDGEMSVIGKRCKHTNPNIATTQLTTGQFMKHVVNKQTKKKILNIMYYG